MGEQYEGSRWCHEPHEDCTRADRFYGIVVTGPVEHREPLPE